MVKQTRKTGPRFWLIAGAGTGAVLAMVGVRFRAEPAPEPAGWDSPAAPPPPVVPAPPRIAEEHPAGVIDPSRSAAPPPAPDPDPFEEGGTVAGVYDRRRPIPGTERAYYEEFRTLAQSDPVRFAGMAESAALGDGPLPERVAVLRAATERLEWPTIGPWFRTLLMRGLGPVPTSEEVVFRTYVFRLLLRRASPDAFGRAVLEGLLQERGILNPEERVVIVQTLLDGRDPEAPGRLFGYFTWEDDPRVLVVAGTALRAMGREDQLIPAMVSALAVPALAGGEEVEPSPEQ